MQSSKPQAEPRVRAVSFGPPDLDERAAERWLTRNKPPGIALEECLFPAAANYHRLNRQYQKTLAAIGSARLLRSQVHHLILELLNQAAGASKWKDRLGSEPHSRMRDDDRRFLRELPKVKAAGRLLARHFREFGFQGGPALRQAQSPRGQEPSEFVSATRMSRILARYADNIGRLHLAQRGPLLHRFQAGPFVYAKPIDKRNRTPSWNASVIFGAVFAARSVTAPGASWQDGRPMPGAGKPLYRVAAAFLADLGGKRLSAARAKNAITSILRRNPGIGWRGWDAIVTR